jgi:riboflavin synthase
LWFAHAAEAGITVAKGSIAINGVSLTVVDSTDETFSVVVIPYSWEHTNLSKILPGMSVNLEFDILGKYLQKLNRPGF